MYHSHENPRATRRLDLGRDPDNTPNRCSSSPSRSAPRTAAATTRDTSAATRAPPSQLGSQRLLLRTLRKMGEAP